MDDIAQLAIRMILESGMDDIDDELINSLNLKEFCDDIIKNFNKC